MILLATKTDITEQLSAAGPGRRLRRKAVLPEGSHARIKRVIDKIALEKMAKAAPRTDVLRGSLSQMNVIDLVQSLEMGRKSCAADPHQRRREVRNVFRRRPGHACGIWSI